MSNFGSNTGERFISFFTGKFNLQKSVNGKAVSFGRFDTLDEAKRHRDYCIRNGWDVDKCKLNTRPPNPNREKYIHKVGNAYHINKYHKGGVYVYYGSFETLEEAKRHRDYCIKHNWSEDCKKLQRKKYDLPSYITVNKDGYLLQKKPSKDGGEYYGRWFRTLEEAIHERDLLLMVDWDEDRLIELDEAYGSNYDGGFNEHLLSER